MELIREVTGIFEREPRLIQLPSHGKVIFVGDTHGDLDATEKVISRFLKGADTLVFLGDYVDRGDFSRENVDTLLQTKWEHPRRDLSPGGKSRRAIRRNPFPLPISGNPFQQEREETYGLLFSKFPLAAISANGILALHGGLPELGFLEEINRIEWGDEQWERVLWGDFVEREEEILGDWSGRPQFGRGTLSE